MIYLLAGNQVKMQKRDFCGAEKSFIIWPEEKRYYRGTMLGCHSVKHMWDIFRQKSRDRQRQCTRRGGTAAIVRAWFGQEQDSWFSCKRIQENCKNSRCKIAERGKRREGI